MKIYQVILEDYSLADECGNFSETVLASYTNKKDVESFLERFTYRIMHETCWDGSVYERDANIRVQEIEVFEHFSPDDYQEE